MRPDWWEADEPVVFKHEREPTEEEERYWRELAAFIESDDRKEYERWKRTRYQR